MDALFRACQTGTVSNASNRNGFNPLSTDLSTESGDNVSALSTLAYVRCRRLAVFQPHAVLHAAPISDRLSLDGLEVTSSYGFGKRRSAVRPVVLYRIRQCGNR